MWTQFKQKLKANAKSAAPYAPLAPGARGARWGLHLELRLDEEHHALGLLCCIQAPSSAVSFRNPVIYSR